MVTLPFPQLFLSALLCSLAVWLAGVRCHGTLSALAEQGWEDVRHAERVDPFTLVKAEIDSVSERLRRGILSGIPVLERAAEYFFKVRRWGPVGQPQVHSCSAATLTLLGEPGAYQGDPCALAVLTARQLCSLVQGPCSAAVSSQNKRSVTRYDTSDGGAASWGRRGSGCGRRCYC